METAEAVNYLSEIAGDNVNIIFGTVDGSNVSADEVGITIIATGLSDGSGKRTIPTQPQVQPQQAPQMAGEQGQFQQQPVQQEPAVQPTYSGQALHNTGMNIPPRQNVQNIPQRSNGMQFGQQMGETQPTQPSNVNNGNIIIPEFLKKRR